MPPYMDIRPDPESWGGHRRRNRLPAGRSPHHV